MDAGNAAVPAAAADLENGGGAVTVDAWPYPADQQLKEKQPFTWQRAAPYLAVILAGVALFAAGVLVACTAAPDAGPQDHRAANRAVGGGVLCNIGLVVAIVGIIVASIDADEGSCDRNLQRFGLDD